MNVKVPSRSLKIWLAEMPAPRPGRRCRIRRVLFRSTSGQALIETALIVPFLLLIALNVVNFGYFFLVAVNLAASPRSGTLYSILGDSTPASSGASFPGLPTAGPPSTLGSVAHLVVNDLNGALYHGTSAGVQVCTSVVGLNNPGTTNQTAQCSQYQGASARAADTDLEAPTFVLDRVDIQYKFKPLVPGRPFNIATLPLSICDANGSCTFHRMAEMREMN